MKKAERKTSRTKSQSKARDAKRAKGRRRKENVVVRYFRQTWAELKKVHWPERREATNLTLIVLTVTVAMSTFLGVVDYLFRLFFSLLVDVSG